MKAVFEKRLSIKHLQMFPIHNLNFTDTMFSVFLFFPKLKFY